MTTKPKVALISTGGTITSLSVLGELDMFEYSSTGKRLDAFGMLEKFPHSQSIADVIPVAFDTLLSTAVSFPHWKKLAVVIGDLIQKHHDLAGIVILHGTSSMEETAYALNLGLKTNIPIVLTGAQRPASALSTDAGLNIYNAVRLAACPEARNLGVLICLNDEIQSAREVTKTSNGRLQTFRSPDFGALGHVDGDRIVIYRSPTRRHTPDTEFDLRDITLLPRVDIVYSYAGGDGVAVQAFMDAGAQGLVGAAFAPGLLSPEEFVAMEAAVKKGVAVAISSRAGSGRTFAPSKMRDAGFIQADNLTPQKTRILLAMALTKTKDRNEIQRMFDTY
ncbi:asparaginase [Zwartia vadi]|uniref:asparaginase n=1 Tax=Zwartia vadi TaxID=3058168 RepID=UPI0025B57CB3|nr:asparaginase [Zwartia vadi]MDN3986324.1 asparaginase [Zwartia vadi]